MIKNAFDIQGLYYIPQYLTQDEITMLMDKINHDIHFQAISNAPHSRRVAHYGYFYSYDKSGLKPAEAIPDYLKCLATPEKINQIMDNHILKEFDQVIINEYGYKQKIAPHTDHIKLFGPIVACLTLGQATPIIFSHNDHYISVPVEEGSLYIMTSDARYKWKHSLQNNNHNKRYSITYRHIN